jgi:DNA polymerase-3 subunit delta'
VWPIVGHEWAVELLTRSIRAEKLNHAYLFIGPPQVGKTTLAKAFAQAINCDGESVPCGNCRHCRLVHVDRHPDVRVIEPENGRIKIETIRDLQRQVALSPVEGRYRVSIISQVDRATTSASNSLLKTLEEPPSKVILVLTAHQAESLLPTLVSRCQVLPLRLLPTAQIVSALRARGLDGEQARLLGHLARGRVGWAIAASTDQRVLAHRNQVIERMTQAVEGSYIARFAWAEKLSKRPDQVPETLSVLGSWWRDVLLLTSGGTIQITNVDQESRLREWAGRYTITATKRTLRTICDTTWRLEHNANLRLALEVLMLDMPGGV